MEIDEENIKNSNRQYQESKRLREEILSTEERILDILTSINKLSSNEAKNSKEISKLLQEGVEAEERLLELQNLSIKANEKNAKLSKDGTHQLREQRDIQEEIIDAMWGDLLAGKENQEKLQTKLNQLEHKFSDEVAAASDSMLLLNDNAKKVLETTNYTDIANNSIEAVYARSNQLLKERGNLSQGFLDYLENQEWSVREMADLQMDVVKQIDKAAAGEYSLVDLTRARLDLMREERSLQFKKNEMSNEEYDLAKNILDSKRNTLEGIESQQDAYKKVAEEAEKVFGVMEKMTSGDFKGAFTQQFKLDDINKQIKQKVGGALVNVIKDVKAGNLSKAFSGALSGLTSMVNLAPKLLAALGIGAIIALGNFLIDTFIEVDKEVSQLGKDFGISKHEAIELHHATADVANQMKITGIHSEEVAKGLKTVSDNLGGIDLTEKFSSGNAAVQQMVKDTTILTEKFGLSGEEAGNLNNIAAITGKSVGEMSMMATTLGKGMFSAKESMKILAGIPKSIVSQMSKMPEAMIRTAMHAKALGMNMKQIADIGRKSLDIEESLEAEMEARAIIGKDINLDTMRAAALQGDQETVANELLKTAGSMKDFNNMNVLQKEALAKAAGMEVDQMAEMLGKQEELNKAGITQEKLKELQGKNAEELLAMQKDSSTEQGKAYNEYLKKLSAEKESTSLQETMASMMKRLQQLAAKIVGPILDLVDGLMKGGEGAGVLGGVFENISAVVGVVVDVVKMLVSIIISLLKPLFSILGIFIDISKAVTMSLINPLKESFATVFMPLLETFNGIYDTISNAFSPLQSANKSGEKTVGIVDMIKKGFQYIFPVISFVGGLIVKSLVKPFELFGGLISSAIKILTGDFKGGLDTLGGTIFNFFLGIPKMVLSGIGGAIDAIFGTKITESITKIFDWIETGFKSVFAIIEPIYSTISKIGGFIVDNIIQPFKTAYSIIQGIGKIFSGDLLGGIKQIGTAILDNFMTPINSIKNIILSLIDMISGIGKKIMDIIPGGGAISGAVSSIGSAIGGLVGMASGGDVKQGGLAIVGEKGPEVVSLPSNATVASTGAVDQTSAVLKTMGISENTVGKETNNTNINTTSAAPSIITESADSRQQGNVQMTSTTSNMSNVEKKLDTLIGLFSQAANQPTVIKFGDKTVEEFKTALNFKKAYNIGIDNTYGRSI